MSRDYDPEPPRPSTSEFPDGTVEYLERKGSMEIFAYVSETNGMRFTDLDNTLNISPSTLTRRLETGRDLGLLEVETRSNDLKVVDLYYATRMGQIIHNAVTELQVREVHRQLTRLRNDLEDRRDELVERAEEGQRALHDFSRPKLDEDDFERQ